MAGQPDPLEGSHFTVDLGGEGVEAFARVELPLAVLDEVAFRSGDERTTEARKAPGLARYTHLVLSRGVTTNLSLWQWWASARAGDPGIDRDVVVTLLDPTQAPRVRWRFRNAFPVVYRLSPLDATDSDVVTETVELAFDTMDAEALA
jgi:phage tail-like protein